MPADKIADKSATASGPLLNGRILDTIRDIDHSILSIGLDLVKIRDEKLFGDFGFPHMSAYVSFLVEQSKKNRSSIYKWLQIGEIYQKYKLELEKVGFRGNDSPTKLPYLERALAIFPKDEVFANIKTMTQREFASYAKHGSYAKSGGLAKGGEEKTFAAEDAALNRDEISEKADNWGHSFFYREIEAARVNKDLPRSIYRMLIPAIRLSFNALDKKSYVVAVHLDNYREYVRFLDVAVEAREQMRLSMAPH